MNENPKNKMDREEFLQVIEQSGYLDSISKTAVFFPPWFMLAFKMEELIQAFQCRRDDSCPDFKD